LLLLPVLNSLAIHHLASSMLLMLMLLLLSPSAFPSQLI